MAALETLRNKAGIFVAIAIGLALLAFILGDFSQGRSVFSSDDMSVGSVNGTSLSYPDFQRTYDVKLNSMQMYARQMDPDMLAEQVRNQVWESFVRQQLFDREFARLGLAMTDEEFSSRIIGADPHPMVKQLFSDQATGEFNREFMLNFLQNLSQAPDAQRLYWLEAEQQLHESMLSEKYEALVVKGLGVTSLEVAFQDTLHAQSVDAAYIYRPFSMEPDSLHRVTTSEAKDYYRRNREKYRAEAKRDLTYVAFEVKPADRDYDLAKESLGKLTPDFAEASDARAFAQQMGENVRKGGWLQRKDLPGALAGWAFDDAQAGDVSPVVLEGDVVMLARLLDRKELADSAHARHILFSTQKYPMAEAQGKADSVAELIRKGGDFAALATEFSDDPGSKSKGGDLDWFPQGMMVPEFNDACFAGKAGDVVVVATQFGVHVIEVLGHRGKSPYAEVAMLSQRVEAGSLTRQELFNKANKFAATATRERDGWLRAGKKEAQGGQEAPLQAYVDERFDSLANASGVTRRSASGVEASWSRISGLPSSRELVRWAYEAEEADVSRVFELIDSRREGQSQPDVFVVAMLQRVRESEDGYALFEGVRGDVERDARQEKKAQTIAKRFGEALSGGKDFSAAAQELGEGVRSASSVTFNSYSFGQEGYEPKAVGAGSSLRSGQVVTAVVGNSGVFAMVGQSVGANSGAPASDRADLQESMRRSAGYEVYGALKRLSHIKDNRARFF